MKDPEVMVIGGGFAGLSAAIHLAARGADVCLVEREAALGGKAGEVRAGGFRFDTGPSVFTLPRVFEEVFAAAGRRPPIALEPLDLLCRYAFPSGRVWDVYHDVERTVAPLSPAEADAYVRVLEEARRLYEAAAPTFVYGAAPSPSALARWAVRHGWRAHPHRTLERLLAAYGAQGDLATFFLRFATYFGADPYRAPAILHNVAWAELGVGAVYPSGGVRAAVDALAALAAELGVRIRSSTEVTALRAHAGRIRNVSVGREVLAPRFVVSAVDRARTLGLLGRTPPAGAGSSLSGLVLMLGVEGSQPRLAHHTVAFPARYRAEFDAIRRGELPEDPTLYLHLSCRREPRDAPDGAENWFVMANAPALPASAGADASRMAHARRREEAYADAVEAKLRRMGLLQDGAVRVRLRRGPSDLARLGHRGAIYGRAPHSLRATLRPTPRLGGLDNLALAGGTVHPGGGIPLALLSGREAARIALRALAR